MANEEQISILKQGVNVWNEWRRENPRIEINLKEANLRELNLRGANLRQVVLTRAFLGSVDLSGADLRVSNLGQANLQRAALFGANLTLANLAQANLSEADLRGANLHGAELRQSDLRGADLRQADLRLAQLPSALLNETGLSGAMLDSAFLIGTQLSDLDLSEIVGLDEVTHMGPSTIGSDTLAKSKGKIPEVFLRGCGMSDWEIEQAKLYNPDLGNDEINAILYKVYDLRATQALQISPLFISYSHSDSSFVDKLDKKLTGLGVRFWRDIHDMKAGRMEKQIDRAIRQNPTVVMILSESSLGSDWVEHEVHFARELEKELGRDILCPIRLDDSWKDSKWEKRLMEQVKKYNILDFSEWQEDSKFEGMFRKLIDGLELFYKG